MKLIYLPKWFRSFIKYINKNGRDIWTGCFALIALIGGPLAIIEFIVYRNIFPIRMFIAGLIIVPGTLLFLGYFVINIFIDRVLYEDRLEQNYSNGRSVIPFSLFEGAYARNPEAWTLAEDHVERVSDEHYQGKGYWFIWSDYKRYVKFYKKIKKQKEDQLRQLAIEEISKDYLKE